MSESSKDNSNDILTASYKIKEQVKLYEENPNFERPSQTLKIIKERAENSVLSKANADVLLSLLMQRLVGADPDAQGKNNKTSDLRLQVGEYPVYEIKAQGGWIRDTRAPIITKDIMDHFVSLITPEYIQNAMVEVKSKEKRTDVDQDFAACSNVNPNFNYSYDDKEYKGTIKSNYCTKPQYIIEPDGAPDITLSRYRINLSKALGEYILVIRKIDSEIPDFFELGLNTRFLQFITYDKGLVLVTGPTGSGKSTTLAAMINEINKNYRKNIITLENPVEFVHKNNKSFFMQRDIPNDSRSFPSSIKSALRQAPDIILFGEMRDPETIEGALEAAETGHLVFGTLHTSSAAKTIDRIIGTFPIEGQDQIAVQLSTSLLGCISQMLVKTKTGGITALNEMLLATPSVRGNIAERKTAQISAIVKSNADDHLSLLDHARDLIVNDVVDQNAVFGKIYRESIDDYKALVKKLESEKKYNPDEDEYTEKALAEKARKEIERLIALNKPKEEKKIISVDKSLSEVGQIEQKLDNEEKNKEIDNRNKKDNIEQKKKENEKEKVSKLLF